MFPNVRNLIYLYDLGEIDDDINFTFNSNSVIKACTATLNNEMYVLGGVNNGGAYQRQVDISLFDQQVDIRLHHFRKNEKN